MVKTNNASYRGCRQLLASLSTEPQVTGFMVDFESVIWKALKTVFADIAIRGCVFHMTQAIWRKVQERGLQTAYGRDRRLHTLIRQVSTVIK